jgi:hypothetical protein
VAAFLARYTHWNPTARPRALEKNVGKWAARRAHDPREGVDGGSGDADAGASGGVVVARQKELGRRLILIRTQQRRIRSLILFFLSFSKTLLKRRLNLVFAKVRFNLRDG